MNALEVRALGKTYLDIKAGEVFALVGPNGAGKSTYYDADELVLLHIII